MGGVDGVGGVGGVSSVRGESGVRGVGVGGAGDVGVGIGGACCSGGGGGGVVGVGVVVARTGWRLLRGGCRREGRRRACVVREWQCGGVHRLREDLARAVSQQALDLRTIGCFGLMSTDAAEPMAHTTERALHLARLNARRRLDDKIAEKGELRETE